MGLTIDRKLLYNLELISVNKIQEEFISYEEMCKKKKKLMMEEDASHLNEIFSKVR